MISGIETYPGSNVHTKNEAGQKAAGHTCNLL